MKKTILFLAILITAGGLSYLGGYYLYVANRPKIVLEEPEIVSKGIMLSDAVFIDREKDYYLVRIEDKMLNIYDMPEEVLYDSVSLQSLQLQENDAQELLNGKIFLSLPEVFEFLESCMS